ncbi:MAG: M20/M25/M40 family metallo-hydrolase [Anaerolineae bacterium]|nr:M20/M25/M40 family metallo-hydrolase [Anaerolineae bacterium]
MAQTIPPTLQRLIEEQASRSKTAILLDKWLTLIDDITSDAIAIQSIPAPTFEEQARADAIRKQFEVVGLHDVHQDEVGNVVGRTPGTDANLPALLISAHLDTVFPIDTDLSTHYDATARHITGPGLGDNSLGLAALLGLARQITLHQIVPGCDVWWVATVGEEGLGDLRGMRHICLSQQGKIGLGLVIEGLGLGRVYHAGLGVRRLRVETIGPGGHSWLHSDRPSAIHHLIELGAALIDLFSPPAHPHAIFNIGLISGGTSINTRAPQASLSIDLRAIDNRILTGMESKIIDVIHAMPCPAGLRVSVDLIGNRPSATLQSTHPLVQTAQGVLDYVHWGPSMLDTGSTDANIPLAMGIPSVCIGITTGANAHTIKEYIDIAPIAAGMQQLTLLTLLAAEHMRDWQNWHSDSIRD